jgi:hypothetical protein
VGRPPAASVASTPADLKEIPGPATVVATERHPAPAVATPTPMVGEPEARMPAPSSSPRKALPDGELTQGPIKPIEPPSSVLRFDYDLDHGTPMTPGNQDPQRTF